MSGQSELERFRRFVYNSYSETHAVYSDEEAGLSRGRQVTLRKFLESHLPRDRSAFILDFGCGDGLLLSTAEQLGYRHLAGVDLSEGLLAIAAKRTSAQLHLGNGMEFLERAPSASYDVVLAFDVFEHLTRPELLDASREIERILKPGGVLLLHLPNGASPYCGAVRWGDITHEQAFTRSSLTQVLTPLGFRDIVAFEEAPVPHGLKSTARAWLWRVIHAWRVANLAIETGRLRGHVLTMNMYVRAEKA
jgi:2-polyprenyl-3-methyl-5-hydroxy-6-metoxy-1,4-benzoquinol methylase